MYDIVLKISFLELFEHFYFRRVLHKSGKFEKKLTKNGSYANCAWVMVIIDMNYQNVFSSSEYKRIFFIFFHFINPIQNNHPLMRYPVEA